MLRFLDISFIESLGFFGGRLQASTGESDMKPEDKEVIIIPERCKGCGFCIEFCPQHVLHKSTEINSKGYHLVYISNDSKCTKCDMCGMVCPDFAIGVVDIEKEPCRS